MYEASNSDHWITNTNLSFILLQLCSSELSAFLSLSYIFATKIYQKILANFWGIRINLHQMCLFILGRLRPITICDIRNRFEPDLSRFLRHETVRNGPSCVMERMEETSSITFRLSSNPILLFPGVLKRNVATHKNFFSQKIWKSFYSSTSVLVPPRKKEPQSHVSHLGKSS